MRIAVTTNESSMDGEVDPRFGRCPYFLIMETDDLTFEALENPNVSFGEGAGIQCAQLMAEKGVQVVLTGNCGPNGHQVLSAAGVEVVVGCSGGVRQVVEQFNEGQLKPADEPNASGHLGTAASFAADKVASAGQSTQVGDKTRSRSRWRQRARQEKRIGSASWWERSSLASGTDPCGVPAISAEPKRGAGTPTSEAAGGGHE